MQWTNRAIFDKNNLVEFQGIGTITTDKKEAELRLLQAKQEAEKANKAKSQFLSNMSHELKTPLNAILGFSQILETDETAPLSPEQAECVQHIYQAGKLLLALIGDVLDLSKIETGNVKLDIQKVSVNEVILEALSLIDNIAKDHHINIKTRFDPFDITFINVDPLRFKQILLNLLSNAIKYNSENGLIVLRSIAVSIHCDITQIAGVQALLAYQAKPVLLMLLY
jgi:ribose transport system substrate-binding protein